MGRYHQSFFPYFRHHQEAAGHPCGELPTESPSEPKKIYLTSSTKYPASDWYTTNAWHIASGVQNYVMKEALKFIQLLWIFQASSINAVWLTGSINPLPPDSAKSKID